MTNDTHPRLRMDAFDFHLPEDLIAQTPLQDRSASRLMVLDRTNASIQHRRFAELPDLLAPGDLLVFNDSRVLPARLIGMRATGGAVEILLLREESPRHWRALLKPARRLKLGEALEFRPRSSLPGDVATATIREKGADGEGIVELSEQLAAHLDRYGSVPLPPYIHARLDDDERYQTVYARVSGSAAAPTAGLHFARPVFARLQERGIASAYVTLHVGLDTFRPVTAEYAENHVIHKEWFDIPAATATKIAEAKKRGSRVVAVGTTAARTLETYGQRGTLGEPESGMTGIYITPGYCWTLVDALVTNFHLPKSTLLLMVSSFAERDVVLRAYAEAVRHHYRFFSFGDAMLIL